MTLNQRAGDFGTDRLRYLTLVHDGSKSPPNPAMSLLVLSSVDVRKVASSFSATFLQELMRRVFIAVSRTRNQPPDELDPVDIQTPQRTGINTSSHTTLFMPARLSLPQYSFEGTSIKVVSVPLKGGDTRGIPGTTLVLNEESGGVEAVINSRELTALRNAAGSSVFVG